MVATLRCVDLPARGLTRHGVGIAGEPTPPYEQPTDCERCRGRVGSLLCHRCTRADGAAFTATASTGTWPGNADNSDRGFSSGNEFTDVDDIVWNSLNPDLFRT